jgi:ribosomal protein L16 Arg81 hydroxylase
LRSDKTYSLGSLLKPITVDDFLSQIWDQRQLIVSRHDPDHYSELFSFAAVDRLVYLARARDQDVLTILPKDKPGTEIRARAAEVSVQELYRRFGAGDTIRISGVEVSWLPLLPLVRDISRKLGVRTDVNAYMTPADSQGFPTHVDHEDVFILQVDGAKEWFVYEPDYPWPLEGLSFLAQQGGFSTGLRETKVLRLAERVVLEKGDLLYIPRGYPHHAVTAGLPSLHLTVGMHPTYRLDLLKAALELASEIEPLFRRALPANLADPSICAQELESSLRGLFTKELLGKAILLVEGKRGGGLELAPDGHFNSLAAIGSMTPSSEVESRDGIDILVETNGEGTIVRAGQVQFKGPLSIEPALNYIQAHKRFKVADLPGFSEDDSKVVLVRRLIRVGLLRLAGFEGGIRADEVIQ